MERRKAKSLFEELAKTREDAAMLECVSGDADMAATRAASKNERVREIETLVSLMVDAIPVDRWAIAVDLHVIHGMSVTVIARKMGVSRSTVYSYLSKAADWVDSNLS